MIFLTLLAFNVKDVIYFNQRKKHSKLAQTVEHLKISKWTHNGIQVVEVVFFVIQSSFVLYLFPFVSWFLTFILT